MGVVFLPSRVTGFSAMSRRQMMTFIDGRQLRANSSQYGAPCGLTCRLTFMMTCFSAISSLPFLPAWSLRRVIPARPRRDHGNIHRLVGQLNIAVDPFGARRLQPVCVIPVREIGFVVSAAGFVA